MPLTGEAKRKWQREYMRAKRARARGETPAAEMTRPQREAVVLKALMTGSRATVDRALEQTGLTRQELTRQLTESGLPMRRILRKFAEKLEAKKLLVSRGSHGLDTLEADDNDAQLRAAEGVVRLHERAGTIPAAAQGPGGGASITVVEVNYYGPGQHQDSRSQVTVDVEAIEQVATPTGGGEKPAT